jgi:hypothetical protein
MAQAAVGAVPMVVSGGDEDTRLLINRMSSSDERSELRHREVMDAIRGSRDNEGAGEGLVEALLVGPMELIGAYFQFNPTNVGKRREDLELDNGATKITRIHRSLTIFP